MRGALITQVSVLRSIFSRKRHLTADVGRPCPAYAAETHKYLVNFAVDYQRPSWHLAGNVEIMWRSECPSSFASRPGANLSSRVLILGESAAEPIHFLGMPLGKGDLFYIQKLVSCMEVGSEITW
ncbi:MAG: hypothetical protein JSW66_18250 [Phycisphaerales bacterium]|nr:MAG: hypothetical protein JSW66_18250 [Phycisphaerales bacterium]